MRLSRLHCKLHPLCYHRAMPARWPAKLSALVLLPLVLIGCATPVKNLYPPKPGEKTERIYVVNHGWHTGLIFKSSTLPQNARPDWPAFRGSQYLEVGWGDDGFYRAQKITLGITLKALFWRNPAVLHVVAMDKPPETYFPYSGLIRVDVSEEGYRRLCDYLAASYGADASGHRIDLGKGIYGESRFYRATGHYYFPNTCNVWTARAIRTTGAPITPPICIMAGTVFSQAEHFGTLERRPQ